MFVLLLSEAIVVFNKQALVCVLYLGRLHLLCYILDSDSLSNSLEIDSQVSSLAFYGDIVTIKMFTEVDIVSFC